MSRPDRTVTQAHVLVVSEKLSEKEMELTLRERLKDMEIESLEVERVGETFPEGDKKQVGIDFDY